MNVTSKHLELLDVRSMNKSEKKGFGRTSSVSTIYNYSYSIICPYKPLLLSEFKRIIWGKRVIDALIKSFSLEYGKQNKIVVKKKTAHQTFRFLSTRIRNGGKSSPHIFGASFLSPFNNVVGIHFIFWLFYIHWLRGHLNFMQIWIENSCLFRFNFEFVHFAMDTRI